MADPGNALVEKQNQQQINGDDNDYEYETDDNEQSTHPPQWPKNPAGHAMEGHPGKSPRISCTPPIPQPYFAPANTTSGHPQQAGRELHYDDNPFVLPPPGREKTPTYEPLHAHASRVPSMQPSRSPTLTPVAGCKNLPSIFVGYEGAKSNPHFARTRQGTTPRLPGPNAHPYTDAIFERIVFSNKALLANISDHQHAIIDSDPNAIRILFSLNASHTQNIQKPQWGEQIASRIQTWGFDDDALEVIEAAPKGPVSRGKNNQPYVWILVGASEETRALLDWQQTFAFEEDYVFFSKKLEVKPNAGHWVVETLGGARITSNTATMKTVIDNAHTDLVKKESFKTVTHRIYRLRGIPGTPEEHANYALNTLSILYVHSRDHITGAPRPLWLVMCEPITEDVRDHNLWLKCFRDLTFRNGMTEFTHPDVNVSCDACKAITHYHYECPQTGVPGWMGPVSETGAEFEKHLTDPKEPRPTRPVQGRPRGGFKRAAKGGKHK
ncbi:hypothetical protein D9619_000321 [Psilocybe cf. subviscida]|uniref:Uncharacterized protein n=1 Tax=Psilocybe cf. subviscida TaxID=2480587 RepID=A0A8H5F2D8_9AGAR|nr:hypothetical protein D9619_000321 [Psilocybe cf. subviscida]